MGETALLLVGVGLVFWALAKSHARPGFNALTLGIFLAGTPFFSRFLPMHAGTGRDAATFFLLLVMASVGTAIGGGLQSTEGEPHEHPHDHGMPHSH